MKIFLTLSLATGLFAQASADLFQKAPPDVDNALRERVKGFYQCHIDGTYRKAEKFVAEESQEFFYQMQKQRYEGCETLRINYTEDFKSATVTEVCKGIWNISGNDMKVSMPISTTWVRTEGGEWFWRHVQPKQVPSPFGEMNYAVGADGGKPAAAATGSVGVKVAGGIQIPQDMKAAGEMLLKQVSVDKSDIVLSSYEKAEEKITITNNSGGLVKLTFDYEAVIPGFVAEFDKKELPAGGKAVLKLSINPKDRVAKPTLYGRILAEPLMQQFQVKVTFAIPPELEKQIPKK
jgi:hypothetical protein